MLVRLLDRYAPPARAGAIVGCLLFALALGLDRVPLSVDAHAYWAANPLDPYNFGALYTQDAYFYSPAFTQALGPLHGLPWPAFAALWTILLTAVLAWLGGRWFAWVLLVPFVAIELAMGNIHILMAAAIVVGFRWPAAWAFIILTKVTPGVGLIWFAVRREWRALAIAVAVTIGIGAVSFAIAPGAWSEWMDVLRATPASTYRESTPFDFIPLPVRVVAAAVLVGLAGLTDRRWVVPIAATLALPVVYINGLALLVAAPYLWTLDRRRGADAVRADLEPAAVAPAGAAPSLPR
jgi:glycosyl transferase family 87